MANGTVIRAADYLEGSKSAGVNEALAANKMRGPRYNVPTVLELPAGIHDIGETIQFGGTTPSDSQYGTIVRGWGTGNRTRNPYSTPGGTILRWRGPEGGILMSCYGVVRCRFSDFMLEGNANVAGGSPNIPPGLPKAGVGLDFRGSHTGAVSTGCIFENISIYGCEIGLRIGGEPVAYSAGGGGDQVDQSTFHSIHVRECNTGCHCQGNQAVGVRFHGCAFSWWSDTGFKALAGSISIRDNYFGTCRDDEIAGGSIALRVGAEAAVHISSEGHWELGGGCPAIVGDELAGPRIVTVTGQNFLIGRPDLRRPLIKYSVRGKLFIDQCRFDSSAVNGVNYQKPEYAAPIVVVPPAELVLGDVVTRHPIVVI